MRCRLCGSDKGNRVHIAREMMFGTQEVFKYIECSTCGCLQIAEIPPNLNRYYPPDYYSVTGGGIADPSPFGKLLKRKRAQYLYGEKTALGWFATILLGTPEHYKWMTEARATYGSRIADVGCGRGSLLHALRMEGFRDLTGFEPLIARPLDEPGFRILKLDASQARGLFDVVMLHHVLEHIPNQDDTLRSIRRLVRPGGTVIVRIPVLGWAWHTYGVDWVQLDAPRHLVLHTERSMRELARRCHFIVNKVEYDSTEFQFWGSEQYRHGAPLQGSRSLSGPARPVLFTRAEMNSFRLQAIELNARREGDQACFYLRLNA